VTAATVVLLPFYAPDDDATTVAWCRGIPLAIAEGLGLAGIAQAVFVPYTTGVGTSQTVCHLADEPPRAWVSACLVAAQASVAITGLASLVGDPFVRLSLLPRDPAGRTLKVPVDAAAGNRTDLCRAVWAALASTLGHPAAPPPPSLAGTRSEEALLSCIRDREVQYRKRRWGGSDRAPYRELLSALTCDPQYDAAAIELMRRAGEALVAGPEDENSRIQRGDARHALTAVVRMRPADHVAWTLLGMVLRCEGDESEASRALRQATVLSPDYGPAHRELGSLLLDLGDLRAAGAHLRRAGQANPRDPLPRRSLQRNAPAGSGCRASARGAGPGAEYVGVRACSPLAARSR
jgi:hypothetical protein